MTKAMKIDPTEVEAQAKLYCPICSAEAGEPCTDLSEKPRKRVHAERIRRYQEFKRIDKPAAVFEPRTWCMI
jgi:hypothetical protein